MKLRAISPQFLVDDLAAAIAHYEQRLGFRTDFVYDGCVMAQRFT